MDQPSPTYDELLDLVRRQARIIDELRAEVERLKAELEKSRRAGKRQAAPFSKGDPTPHPKRPGRKPGHPPAHRAIPAPEQVDRTVDVPLPGSCPGCRASLDEADVTVRDQYQVDLPPPRPLITRFRAPLARCPACSRRVQGRHPGQTSDALGAAAVQLGPRLLAWPPTSSIAWASPSANAPTSWARSPARPSPTRPWPGAAGGWRAWPAPATTP